MKTKLTSVDYLGSSAVDRRFSSPMLPWILLEIRRRGTSEKLCLGVESGSLLAYDVNFEPQFNHRLQNIMRFSQIQSTPNEFLYLVKDPKEQLLHCHLFQATTGEENFRNRRKSIEEHQRDERYANILKAFDELKFIIQKPQVSELFGQMKELSHSSSLQGLSGATASGPVGAPAGGRGANRAAVSSNRGYQSARAQQAAIEGALAKSSETCARPAPPQTPAPEAPAGPPSVTRSHSNAANLTSLCVDISPCNSHFFEVLYIGKIKVSHKKVPESLIDDALSKFRQLEQEKARAAHMRRNSLLSSQADSLSVCSDHSSLDSLPSKHQTKRVDFAPLPLPHNKKPPEDSPIAIPPKDGLRSPSLTPLVSNKKFFPENETSSSTSSLKEFSKDNLKTDINDKENVEKEFDELSAVRASKQDDLQSPTVQQKPLIFNKNSFPVALEPKVLVLNWSQNEEKNHMTTLNEDVHESSVTSDASESISVHSQDLDKTIDNQSVSSPEKLKKKVLFNINDKNEMHDEFERKKIESISKSSSDSFVEKQHSIYSSVGSDVSEGRDSFAGDDVLAERKSLKGNMPENKQFARDRSASIGTLNLKTPITQLIGDQNRTMLFQVGRSDLRLISPDRKQVLLHRHLRDVSSCAQGVLSRDHLGFICREPQGQDSLVGYIFKCQSDSVACDVVGAITQAFVAHAEIVKLGREVSPLASCEHCPMVWYHKLCLDIEGMPEKRIHSTILRRIEQLTEEEQTQIVTKYQGGTEDLYEVGEHNAFLMMLLRAHCEAKQQRHVHDTAENRSEFLNQYLGGSTIFMKAKRSLSSSFDHLLKRKGTKDDLGPNLVGLKKESSPAPHASTPIRDTNLDDSTPTGKNIPPRIRTSSSTSVENVRETSIGGQNGGQDNIPTLNLPLQNGRDVHESSPTPQLRSPMMEIFLKLGSSPSPKSHSPYEAAGEGNEKGGATDIERTGSWRQAIFNRITREGISDDCLDTEGGDVFTDVNNVSLLRRPPSSSNLQGAKRTKDELRQLWKNAINQAILLIRMERENARLKARQEVSAVKRIKLEYEDIGGCANENSKVWDMLTAPRESRISTKVDSQMLLQAIRHGVPRAKRGEVWYFLAEQYCLRQPPPDTRNFPNYATPYEVLLKQLTSHQHAILIDLGRTFPSHTYFSSPLGPGQLALFNLLKAYSLLDPEVGYCQGLSFVAGVLLLHLDEAEAFLMLRHLMFRRGLRKQYLPDMVALQIQLYQLSRLVKDHLPDLYDKFDQLDISPTLYAAPWVLTIFTSQFPLGFVTRVFDLLFLESSEVIFRVAFSLLDIHKDGLMLCDSFEEIMEYLKHKIPNIDKVMLDKVIKMAFTLDLGRQLNEYQVEYNVLQEEMAAIAPKMAALAHLEVENRKLQSQNHRLNEQLEETMSKVFTLQSSHNKVESQVKSLEKTVASLARYIGITYDKKKDNELPNDIRRLCQQVQQNDRKTLGVLGQKLGQNFSSKFALTDFSNNLNGASGVSEESSSDADEKVATAPDVIQRKHSILKTGLSTPNLFQKMAESKKETAQKNPPAQVDLNLQKKRQYLSMKKSMSCNAGLMAPKDIKDNKDVQPLANKITSTLKSYPLRVLDENSEYHEKVDKPKLEVIHKNSETFSDNFSDTSSVASNISSFKSHLSENLMQNIDSPKLKGSGFFAHSHQQIQQEKMQAEQLKKDFDENLKRLDARLCPNSFNLDKSASSLVTQSSENISRRNSVSSAELTEKLNESNQKKDQFDFESKVTQSNTDSGLGTPLSPGEKNLQSPNDVECKTAEEVIVNHPLVGCDLDIKFDVHSSKLKSIRPLKVLPVGSRISAENTSSRN